MSNVSSILDRFLHRSELFQLMGRSYRLGSSKNNSKGAKALTGSDADTKTVDKASKGAKACTGSDADTKTVDKASKGAKS